MYTGNKWLVYTIDDNILSQIISNFTLSVDTFFFMSGFLLSYSFLKERQNHQEVTVKRINEYIQKIIKRYIR